VRPEGVRERSDRINPVGRAIFFNELGQYSSDGIRFEWAVKSTVSPNRRDILPQPRRLYGIRGIPQVARDNGLECSPAAASYSIVIADSDSATTAHC